MNEEDKYNERKLTKEEIEFIKQEFEKKKKMIKEQEIVKK